jgi:LmbE family N-acetylglucosaminyl deacetylase
MAAEKSLLICYAHPDDESFGLGAFVARYVKEGVEVSLICATNGDAGTVAPERLKGYGSIAELRLAELACASQILGFHEVITFGYRDSGMMQDTQKDNPASLWQAPLDDVAKRIVEVIQRLQPQVVITFDPYGGYGHPDHIKMHLATNRAFAMLKESADPAMPAKLYYAVFPKAIIQLGVRLIKLRGGNPRKMGVNRDMDFQAVLDNVPPVHALIDVADYLAIGDRAAACHASQMSPRAEFPGAKLMQQTLNRKQRFARAIPPPKPNEPLEFDLFTGVKIPVREL